MSLLIPTENVQSRILLIQGHKVILDADLARLYGVTTKRLNEQVKRNLKRFPSDFMIHLTKKEKDQVVANCDHLKNLKFSPVLPYAFTEHGALMVANILNTESVIKMGTFIVRAFIKLRDYLSNHQEIAYKLKELELQTESHSQHIQSLWDMFEQLKDEPLKKQPVVEGFKIGKAES